MNGEKENHDELSEVLDDLTSRLSKIEKDIHDTTSNIEEGDLQNAIDIDDEVESIATDGQSNITIDNIKRDLHMKSESHHGYCADCGIKIPESRIQALPHLDTCAECAEE